MTLYARKSGSLYPTPGFTLLELMVALALFSILSVISFRGLQSILDTHDNVQRVTNELAALQTAFGVIGRDSTQMVNRSVRDQLGDLLPSIVSDESKEPQLEFTCFGLSNRSEILYPNLIRVGYSLQEGNLFRFSWRVLDRAFDSEPVKTKLAAGVIAFEFRFLDENRRWHEQWPPANTQNDPSLPLALELTLELENWGRIRRIFKISG